MLTRMDPNCLRSCIGEYEREDRLFLSLDPPDLREASAIIEDDGCQ